MVGPDDVTKSCGIKSTHRLAYQIHMVVLTWWGLDLRLTPDVAISCQPAETIAK